VSVEEWIDGRVQFEHVPLVRRVMAANDHPEVAMIGMLGEITFLVEHYVTAEDVQILESEIASAAVPDRRVDEVKLLNLRSDLLEQYIGRRLLRARFTKAWEYSTYELTIDLESESIVAMAGFSWRDPTVEEPVDASLIERVRWIFEHYPGTGRDRGKQAVETLLAGRDMGSLSSEELYLLAQGYNWCNLNANAMEVAKVGLSREPESREWLSRVGMYLRSAYMDAFPQFLSACDLCIAESVGPPSFWHLKKADYFVDIAVGEFEIEDLEWSPGDEILHPELLRLAAEAMEAALVCEPELRGRGNWNERFAAVFTVPEFRHLMG